MSTADPVRGLALTLHVPLGDRANPGQFKANPTLAAGDVKVSKDGGAFANLTTLPDVHPAAGIMVRIQLTASEMDADEVIVQFRDAAGDEWTDKVIAIQTRAHTLDETYAAAVAAGDADPLENPVPGSYGSGTAGAALGRIGSSQITITSPVTQDGTKVTLISGDDYLNANGRALVFTRAAGSTEWPDLTGATVRLKTAAFAAIEGTVVVPTGTGQQVRFDVARTLTASLADIFGYEIEATLATSGNVVTLLRGTLVIVQDV